MKGRKGALNSVVYNAPLVAAAQCFDSIIVCMECSAIEQKVYNNLLMVHCVCVVVQ